MERPTDHGGGAPRGLDHVPRSSIHSGRYGRMFRSLPAFSPGDALLGTLADSMVDEPPEPAGDNPGLPAGYTYLGQFVDHDITFDPVSSLVGENDPDALENFRTPRFDLDCLYGRGPADSPYLYDRDDPAKLLVGANREAVFEPVDLPRNQQGRALIGDPRNDVHVIVGQLHLAFIHCHNAAVDHLRARFFSGDELFDEARRLVRWHYQWVVVHDYLARLVGPEMLDRVLVADELTGGARAAPRFFTWKRQPFLPVEFSAAAYRFGHSQVRAAYKLNPPLDPLPILTPARDPHPLQHLGGFRPLPKTWTVDWSLFFDVATPERPLRAGATRTAPPPGAGGTAPSPQLSRRIDTRLTAPLRRLPEDLDPARRSLALLNLLRGRALGLPSGQAVAAAMGTTVPDVDLGLAGETPLWFYLLRESEVAESGLRLGLTSGRIVAEVVVGLLSGDPSSYLRAAPAWRPELPSAEPGRFTMSDLLRFAGVLA